MSVKSILTCGISALLLLLFCPGVHAQVGGPGGPGGPGGGTGGPQVTGVQLVSGTIIQITYDLDQNYPTGGSGFVPYAQLLRDQIEVDRITAIPGASGQQTINMDARSRDGWYTVNLILNPPGNGAGVGRKFHMDDGAASMDSGHQELIGESGVPSVPFEPLDPNCDPEEPPDWPEDPEDPEDPGGCDPPVGPSGPNGPGNCPRTPSKVRGNLGIACEPLDFAAPSTGATYQGGVHLPQLFAIDVGNAKTSLHTRFGGSGGSGCSTCTTAIPIDECTDMPDVQIAFRPQKVGHFGGGVSIGYELVGYGSSTHIYMSNNTTPVAMLNDTLGIPLVAFEDDLNGDPVDGILYDQKGFYKDARLLDVNDNLVTALTSATQLVVTRHRGGTMTFELIDPDDSDPASDQDGRLVEMADRNGHGSTITYSSGFKINTVTDYHGNVLNFAYGAEQKGQIAISSITFPGGNVANLSYTDGQLSGVSMNSEWNWSASYSSNALTQTSTVSVSSPHDGTRSYQLAQDYIEQSEQLLNQPLHVTRAIDDPWGNGHVTYYPDSSDPNATIVVRGSDIASTVRVGEFERWAGSFSIQQGPPGVVMRVVISDEEDEYGQNDFTSGYTDQRWILGAPPRIIDENGDIIDQEFDANWFLTKRTYGDGTFEEWTRNGFKQTTRYRNRLGQVIKFEYDANGNLTKRMVGILDVAGTDVNQSEYGEYRWEYYGSGPLKGLLKTEFTPLNTGQSDTHRVDYEYKTSPPNIGRVEKIREPALVSGGNRPETLIAYDASGRISSVTDPRGRVKTPVYDNLNRVVQINYNDGSNEQFLYGANGSGNEARIVKQRDRSGTVTSSVFDDFGRIQSVTEASAVDADILDGQPDDQPITDAWQKSVTSYTYVDGTDRPATVTTDGKMVSISYDYRGRAEELTSHPSSGVTLVTKNVYVDNRLFYTEDDLGRRSWFGYRDSDGELIRQVQGFSPDFQLADNAAVLNLVRDANANASYAVFDAVLDAGGRLIQTVDARGIQRDTVYDSRNRETRITLATGTAMEAITESDYDASDNILEVRTPRYFDSADPQSGKVKTVFAYNGRELMSSKTEAPGTPEAATTSVTYYDDNTPETFTDPRGFDWTKHWHSCCGRPLGYADPLGHGAFTNNDYEGRRTHSAGVADYASISSSHDPDAASTLAESTRRYDSLGRLVYKTHWFAPLGNVDPNAAPIAGLDGVSASDGTTSQTHYDQNLGDGEGLDSTGGITIPRLGGGTWSLSLETCLNKLSAETGVTFGSTSAGSAMVVINGEEQVSVTISDAIGRTVMTGIVESHQGSTPGDLVTWNLVQHDLTFNKTGFGLLSETRSIDAFGKVRKSRSDGGQRVLESVDANNQVTTNEFDANGNRTKSRDPNNVGFDATYNEHNQAITLADTAGDSVAKSYDREGHVLSQTDGKGEVTSVAYDARGRRSVITDRLNGQTVVTYDGNNNVKTVVDTEGKTTSFDYDSRNAKIRVTWPDHVTGSVPGDAGYGIKEFTRDAASRVTLIEDQLGDTTTNHFDMAGRLASQDFRTRVNSPSGTIADTNTFTYDNTSKMLTAISGRYQNTVTRAYDLAGRLASESLAIGIRTYTVAQSFDDRGQLSRITLPDGKFVDRTYSDSERLYQVSYNGSVVDTRLYDNGDRLDKSTYLNGVDNDYGYLANNLMSQAAISHATQTDVGTYTMTYDANRNTTSQSISGVMSAYGFSTGASGHDKEDRLVNWNRTDGNKDQSWTLTSAGNWSSFIEESTTENRTFGPSHEVASVGAPTVQHDARGNTTLIPSNVSHTGANLALNWDFENRISSADTDASGTADTFFEYDALGRRVKKDNTVYAHSGQQVMAEYTYNALPASSDQNWVYGSYVDEPILRDGTGGILYYHHDNRFNVAAITDGTGAVVERYSYDQFGGLTIHDPAGVARSVSSYGNEITYTGRRFDPETGLYYFRSRYFDQNLGRFISRDTQGYVDGPSLYAGYFASLGGVDPTGAKACVTAYREIKFAMSPGKPFPCGAIGPIPLKCEFRAHGYYGLKTTICKKKCCATGKMGEMKKIKVYVKGKFFFAITAGDSGDTSWGGFHVRYWWGLRLEIGIQITGSATFKSEDPCKPDKLCGEFCLTGEGFGAARIGGEAIFSWGRWSWTIAASGNAEITAGVKCCFTYCDGKFKVKGCEPTGIHGRLYLRFCMGGCIEFGWDF